MAIREAVYRWRTFSPVRFQRAVSGAPVADAPDLDDRGFRDDEHGPVVGVSAGDTVRVALRRAALDNSSNVFVTSTNTGVVTVAAPAGGRLPAGDRAEFRIQGAAGGTAVRSARIEARFGSASGPVLGALTVWVLPILRVRITPHLVTIRDAAGGSRGSIANVNTIMTMAQAIWRPCGVQWTVGTVRNEDVTYQTAGIARDEPFTTANAFRNTEIAQLLNTNWVTNTINVYFVHRIGTGVTLGYGFRRSDVGRWQVPNPGIIVADTNSNGFVRDTQNWAGTSAHEVGHFLGLEHAGDRPPASALDDQWGHRMLMYNFALLSAGDRFQDVGYGNGRRGNLITMKDLPQIALDAECGISRNTVSRPSGPY